MSIQQIVFILVVLITAGVASKLYGRIIRNIRLGRELEPLNKSDSAQRWKNLLLIAFGQKKMFKRVLPALLHLAIYVAFLFTQIELIEILIDGFFNQHRFFAPVLGGFYTVIISVIEILSLAAFVATITFIWRRNIKKVSRFQKPEMKGWPKLDANLILLGELILILGIFTMNMSDSVLQNLKPEDYTQAGPFLISGNLGPLLLGSWDVDLLILLERLGWWLHFLVVCAFLLYLPISKHLHIIFAFPNTWFASLKPAGSMTNMPEVMTEVKSMLGLSEVETDMSAEIPDFGAKDVGDLSWKNIMDAYTCTECGRCTAECPANITGKKLSPRKIMMDVRDRASEIGKKLETKSSEFIKEDLRDESPLLTAANFDDGKSLFDYITREEIHACTTCGACVEACPVLINPLDIILQLRRYEILTEAAGPSEWVPMFSSLENSGSVWQMNDDRDAWVTQLETTKPTTESALTTDESHDE